MAAGPARPEGVAPGIGGSSGVGTESPPLTNDAPTEIVPLPMPPEVEAGPGTGGAAPEENGASSGGQAGHGSPPMGSGGASAGGASAGGVVQILPLEPYLRDQPFVATDAAATTAEAAATMAGASLRAVAAMPFATPVPTPCHPALATGAAFNWTPDQSGTLELALETQTEGTILVQSECYRLNSTVQCASGAGTVNTKVSVASGVPVCVVLGHNAGAQFDAYLAPPRCGDGIVNLGEECDFGDAIPGDGCNASCLFEPPELSDVCPGDPKTVGKHHTFRAHNVGYHDRAPPTCGASDGGRDRMFQVTPNQPGLMTLDLTSDFDAVLSVFDDCEQRSLHNVLACSDQPRGLAPERLTLRVEARPYFVVVDGFTAAEMGTFELNVTLAHTNTR